MIAGTRATANLLASARRAPGLRVGRLWRHRMGILGGILIGMAAMAGLAASWLAPHDPTAGNLYLSLRPPDWWGTYPLGTDQQGRDILSRLLFGARVSLLVGSGSVVIGATIGVVLGLLAGYYGGWVDELIMRVADIQLSVPFLALAITVVAVVGSSLGTLILVLGVFGWVLYARTVRAEVLSLRQREFIEGVRALGATNRRIIVFHLLPNVASPLLVIASFAFAQMVTLEASISFLGLGIQPPNPSWGNMLADARGYLQVAWWPAFFPAAAIFLTVLGINLLGDWLRDFSDPYWHNLG